MRASCCGSSRKLRPVEIRNSRAVTPSHHREERERRSNPVSSKAFWIASPSARNDVANTYWMALLQRLDCCHTYEFVYSLGALKRSAGRGDRICRPRKV